MASISPLKTISKGPTSANTDTDHSTSGNTDSYSADANIAPTSVDAADALGLAIYFATKCLIYDLIFIL